MITDNDIAQALKTKKAKPSKQWQDATLQRLRNMSSENHVTDSSGMRISPRDAFASLVLYFFPTSIMNPVSLKTNLLRSFGATKVTVGSLVAVCVITVGTHVVANGATPENSFLYSLDRGFERAEIAFASIGGKVSVAHKHLMHAEERAAEIDVLLRGEASASFSLRDVLIETAYAQSMGANAQLSAHVQLLVDDCRQSLNNAIIILEEIADSASAKAHTQLAVAIEMTSKNISQRLEAGMQASAEADVRPVVRKAVNAVKQVERKARSIQAQIEIETEANVTIEGKYDQKGSDTSVNGNTEIDLDTGIDAKVDVNTQGGLNLNINTSSKRNDGGSATTEADANVEAEHTSNASADVNMRENASSEGNTASDSSDETLNIEAETEINVEVEGNADSKPDTGIVETQIKINTEGSNSLQIHN